MFAYQKFLIRETDRFDPSVFPQLTDSLEQTVAQLETMPAGPAAAMILSFVKDHSISTQHVNDHPQLAGQIHSNALPLQVLEQLFESSRQNPQYRRDLEAYITGYLNTENKVQPG
jgi:hypothetical protein